MTPTQPRTPRTIYATLKKPRTATGRSLMTLLRGYDPMGGKATLTLKGEDWLPVILAIEEEAVREYREALLRLVEAWDSGMELSGLRPHFLATVALLDRSGVTEPTDEEVAAYERGRE